MDELDRNDDPFAVGDDDFGADGGADAFNDETGNDELFADDNGGDDPFAEVDGGSTEGGGYDMMATDANVDGVGAGDLLGGVQSQPEEKVSAVGQAMGKSAPEEEDCSSLLAWKAQWRVELEGKAAAAQQKKEERRKAAQDELQSMADARQKALDARAETNRQDEKVFMENNQTLAQPGANPWERVVSLIDTQVDDIERAKATDRMRTILIQMKGQTSGPGIN